MQNNFTLYNNLKTILSNDNYIEKFKEIYKQFDNKINDIRFLGNAIVVSLSNLNHAINIKYMGKGFQTYISIIASMVAGNKYIVIDEIENGMHFESIKILLENILSLSKEYGLQFFITTHNKELLEILNECLIEKDYKDMLSVYNLYYNKENNIDVINYSQENFSNLIENNNEMRD
ncbi:AAA family ATPase [Brachyspira murdochii]